MREGFDEGKYEELVDALENCAIAWRDMDQIPRRAVNVLVDIAPTMESVAGLYDEHVGQEISDAGYNLQELVWKCVAVDAG